MSTVDACDFDFGLGETVDEVRAQVRRMVRAEIAPLAGEIDRSNQFPRDLWPALGELGDNLEAKQLLGLYAGTGAIGRSFFGPPGLPPAVMKALRDGFAAMSKDAAFIADANQINAELQIGSGEEVQKAVERTLTVPESVLQRAREIFAR